MNEFGDYSSIVSRSFMDKFISTESFGQTSSFDISNHDKDSMVIKNVYQDYDGILESLNDVKANERPSLVATTAKGSLIENYKKNPQSFLDVFQTNTFTLPGKFYCKECMMETMSQIKYLPLEISFWNSVLSLFKFTECCAEKASYPDIIHECPMCKTIFARITAV
jgi:hypothetical protein